MPRQNVETNISETLADGSCTTFLFLPNFDLLLLMVVMMMQMMVKKIVNKDDDNDGDDDDGDDADGDHTCDDDDDDGDDNVTLARPESQKKSQHGLKELHPFYYSYLPSYVPPRFFLFPLPLSESKMGVMNVLSAK